MHHFLSKVELTLEEMGDWIARGGRQPKIGERIKQKARRLEKSTRDSLKDIGEDLEKFVDTLTGEPQRTTAEEFLEHAKKLSSKVEDAFHSSEAHSLSSALEGLVNLLSRLMERVKKTFNLSGDVLSSSPTMLHKHQHAEKSKSRHDKPHPPHKSGGSKRDHQHRI